jgi:hypothetical protein
MDMMGDVVFMESLIDILSLSMITQLLSSKVHDHLCVPTMSDVGLNFRILEGAILNASYYAPSRLNGSCEEMSEVIDL